MMKKTVGKAVFLLYNNSYRMVCAWRKVFKKTLAEDALTKTLPSFKKFLNDNPKFKAMGDFATSLTQFFW